MLYAEGGNHCKHNCALGAGLILKDFDLVSKFNIVLLRYGELSRGSLHFADIDNSIPAFKNLVGGQFL